MSTLVIQPSFRALGQMQVKWQTFEKAENKRQMYGSQAWVDPCRHASSRDGVHLFVLRK